MESSRLFPIQSLNEQILEPTNTAAIIDDDALHNLNCYEYLANISTRIKSAEAVLNRFEKYPDLQQSFKDFYEVATLSSPYDPEITYGDIYTNFILEINRIAKMILNPDRSGYLKRDAKLIKAIDKAGDIIISVYENPHRGIQRSYNMISNIVQQSDFSFLKDESIVSKELRKRFSEREKSVPVDIVFPPDTASSTGSYGDYSNSSSFGQSLSPDALRLPTVKKSRKQNAHTPTQQGAAAARAAAVIKSRFSSLKADYDPQSTTSLAAIRSYRWQTEFSPLELRLGVQARIVRGLGQVNPAFKLYLETTKKLRKPHGETSITHIYFNNLPHHRDGIVEEQVEVDRTLLIESIENEYGIDRNGNIAVITLPADKGLLNRLNITSYKKIPIANIFHELLSTTTKHHTDKHYQNVKNIGDFHISKEIKGILFGSGSTPNDYITDVELSDYNELIEKSLEKFDLRNAITLTESQQQAVYFDFFKFQVPNFINNKLRPLVINFTCKDGIDRGGVSSAYYNFMQSIEAGKPFSEEEFFTALHGAPMMVKGRAMNHHILFIWNVIDAYINAESKRHPAWFAIGGSLHWLRQWRNDNTPKNTKTAGIRELLEYHCQDTLHPTPSREAAKKMAKFLHAEKRPVFSKKETYALQDDELAKILRPMKNSALITYNEIYGKEYLLSELMTYTEKFITAEPWLVESFFSIFSVFRRMYEAKKNSKVKLLQHLTELLHDAPNPVPLSRKELSIIADDFDLMYILVLMKKTTWVDLRLLKGIAVPQAAPMLVEQDDRTISLA